MMIWGYLSVLFTTLVIVQPSAITWSLWLFFVVRLFFLNGPRLLKMLLAVQLVTATAVILNLYGHRSQLALQDQTIEAIVSPNNLSVDGDQLKAVAVIDRPLFDEKVQVFYRLKDEAEKGYWQTNSRTWRMRLKGTVDLPEGRRNFGGFDYRSYLRSKQIERIMSVERWERLGPIQGFIPMLHRWQQQLSNKTLTIEEPLVRAYLQSLLLNVRDEMDIKKLSNYQIIGMIHLFSISGFHVSLLLGLLRRVLLRIGLIQEHVNLIALMVLIIYGFMIGWPYGMLRVAGEYFYRMLSLIRRRGQPSSPIEGTLFSMALVLLLRPTAILLIGFQLSYSLALALRYSQQFGRRSGLLRTSMTCFLTSLPFILYHYQRFSWVSIIAGPLYMALFSYLLIPGLLVIFSGLSLGLPAVVKPCSLLLDGLIRGLETFSEKLAGVDFLNPVTGILPIWAWFLLFITLFVYFDQQEHPRLKRRLFIYLMITFCCLEWLPFLNPCGQVAMIDIGQGDTFLIVLPFHRGVYLVDAAERVNFATEAWRKHQQLGTFDRLLAPALRAQGVRELDAIFVTHADMDHIGALSEVAAQIPTKRLYLPIGMVAGAKSQRFILDTLEKSKNPTLSLQWLAAGDRVQLKGESELQILAPNEVGEGKNEDSLVMHGAIGPLRWLFTGDIVGENEEDVFRLLAAQQLPVDILKVSHHGSEHSTKDEWIEQLRPRQAWFSVGKNNRYGHPSDRIIQKMIEIGVVIYRTDYNGGTHYYYLGDRWWVKTVK